MDCMPHEMLTAECQWRVVQQNWQMGNCQGRHLHRAHLSRLLWPTSRGILQEKGGAAEETPKFTMPAFCPAHVPLKRKKKRSGQHPS